MASFKRRLQIGGSIMLPLVFLGAAHADAPVVDLVAKPENTNSAYVAPARSVEQRLQILERKMDNDALIDFYQRLETLQFEVQQLRGLQEEQGHDVEGIKQHQRDLYLDLDQRISSLQLSVKQLTVSPVKSSLIKPTVSAHLAASPDTGESGTDMTAMPDGGEPPVSVGADLVTGVTPVIGEASGSSNLEIPLQQVAGDGVAEVNHLAVDDSEPVASLVPEPINPLQEQADYQKALDLLMENHYEQAISSFTSFLMRYPVGEYRMNAQYWLGEAYYVTRRFDQAIESFDQVIADKDSRKRPDAMLKTGYSFYEQKRWRECRDVLQQLATEYPQSAASGLATQRLQMLQAANL